MPLLSRVLAFTVLVLLLAGCTSPRVRTIGRVGTLAIDGDFDVQSASGLAKINLNAGRLGLDDDDDKAVFEPRIDLDFGPFFAAIEILDVSYSGDGVAEASASLGPGTGITLGAPVASDLHATLSRAFFVVDVVPTDVVDIGIGVGVGFIDYELDVRNKTSAGQLRATDDLAFPFLVGRVAAQFGRFEPELIVGGGAIEIDDEDVAYLDIDLALAFRLFGEEGPVQGDFMIGYRYLLVQYGFEDRGGEVDIDLEFQGPFAGMVISIGF